MYAIVGIRPDIAFVVEWATGKPVRAVFGDFQRLWAHLNFFLLKVKTGTSEQCVNDLRTLV